MSQLPGDHLAYLKRQSFAFRCATAIFPPDEFDVLSQTGNWLEALAAGEIHPVTPEQEHFLQVDREEAEPQTVAERAWVRLKARREFEQDEKQATAPEPQPDYGMIEFDKDRCWW